MFQIKADKLCRTGAFGISVSLPQVLLFIQRRLYNREMTIQNRNSVKHNAKLGAFAHELAWTLEEDRLLWRNSAGGASGVIALSDIIAVQIVIEPSLFGPMQRICRLRTSSGARWAIASAHSLGAFRREDRTASWRALVGPLLRQIAHEAPQARVRRGLSPLAFWSCIAGLVALVAGLAAAYAVLGDKVFTARLALGLALVGVGLPNLIAWLRANRPGRTEKDPL